MGNVFEEAARHAHPRPRPLRPSPTGNPHIGNIRTAMFNWLFARRHGGQFVVRVEDTDQGRITEGAVDHILDGWSGWALIGTKARASAAPTGHTFSPSGWNATTPPPISCWPPATPTAATAPRSASPNCARNRRATSSGRATTAIAAISPARNAKPTKPPDCLSVVRFAMPQSGVTSVEDAIRGHVEWQNDLTDDFVLVKTDGFPTYHMAVVVDDHAMAISHVLRAEEWLPSTPRHVQLYRALELPMPQFGHLPMILGSDRAKLSKRHGATSLMEYRDDGFLPEALINFMALLGWSLDGETEVMSVDTIRDNFTLERVGKPAAIFDLDKLQWMNGVYIRQADTRDLANRILPFLERAYPDHLLPIDREYLLRIVPLVQERLKTLADAPEMLSYFFKDTLEFDPQSVVQRGMDVPGTLVALQRAQADLSAVADADFQNENLESLLRAAGQELELSGRQFFGALRTAITGRTATPPLFEMMEVMGQNRVIERLSAAVAKLSAL